MELVNRLIYDQKGNIITKIRSGEHGATIKEKNQIEYGENGNIVKVNQFTETSIPKMVSGKPTTETTISGKHITEYEYQFFNDNWIVSKMSIDGKVQFENHKNFAFTAANGDVEEDAESKSYVYTDPDEDGEVSLVNTINFRSKQLDRHEYPIAVPTGFDVIRVTETSNKLNRVVDTKVYYGSNDIFCYHKTEIYTNETNECNTDISYWVECEDTRSEVRHFHEYHDIIDKDGNKAEEFICNVYMTDVNVVREVDTQDGYRFKFSNFFDERPYGKVYVSLNEDYEGNTITRYEYLDGVEINHFYKVNDVEYTLKTEFIQLENGEWDTKSREVVNGTSKYREQFLFDSNSRMIMTTVEKTEVEETSTYHIIYKYDKDGNIEYEVSENCLTHHFYNLRNQKEISVITEGYPMAKEVFDLHFNKLMADIFNS